MPSSRRKQRQKVGKTLIANIDGCAIGTVFRPFCGTDECLTLAHSSEGLGSMWVAQMEYELYRERGKIAS